MFRLLWLTPRVKGEFSILRTEQRGSSTFLLLPDNADTQALGVQSLFWDSRKGHCVVEFSETKTEGRWFKVIKTFGAAPIPTKGAWLSGWLGETPEHFGISKYNNVTLSDGTKAVVTSRESDRWVIHVHGRKTLTAETLRNFPLFDSLGFRQMSISHQTDPKPAGLGKHKSTLGLTEWRLVEQAVNYAKAYGAKEVILFGWSLGGMICGQYLKRVSDTSIVKAAIFDSPMFDVRNTLRFQAGLAGYSDQFADEVCELIGKSFLLRLLDYPVIKVDEFSLAKNPVSTNIPMLVLFSLNDGYIEIKDALEFAEINRNVVLQEFEGARHCRLRNSNVSLYERTLKDFISKL
ncbi:MAG: hypothetical protein RJA78_1088 [Actinomycetota bacterium]